MTEGAGARGCWTFPLRLAALDTSPACGGGNTRDDGVWNPTAFGLFGAQPIEPRAVAVFGNPEWHVLENVHIGVGGFGQAGAVAFLERL